MNDSRHAPQILKICYGNDFSLSVSVNVWNAETSAWDKLDLSAAQDIELFLVSQNGKRIKTTSVLNENGDITTNIPAAYLTKTLYSIEITFIMDGRNRRTYSPCMIQIVNSTEDAGPSVMDYVTNDAYHFDIMIKNDIAWLNVGSLPSEYITEEELAETLTSYATISSVENQISSLWSDCNDTFIDNDELGTVLNSASYIDISELDNTLSSYVNNATLDITLASYFNNAEYDSVNMEIHLMHDDTVLSYIDASSFVISGMISNVYVQDGYLYIEFNTETGTETVSIPISDIFDASNYYTKGEIDNTLSSYVTDDILSTTLASSSYITQASLSSNSYVTATDLMNTLAAADYVTHYYLDNASYATESYVTDAIAAIDIPDPDLSSYVTYDYLNAQSYITLNDIPEVDLSSYVKQTTLDTTLASYVTYDYLDAQSYATESYVSNAISEIVVPMPDMSSYVTYTYWDSSNEAIAYELMNNRNAHNDIIAQFGYYYTKTEADGRYASTSWANNKFVTSYDNERQNEAVAYALSYLNDNIGQGGGGTPDLTAYVSKAELNAMSYVDSSTVSHIWSGSQNDYNQLTPNSNTLYVIL